MSTVVNKKFSKKRIAVNEKLTNALDKQLSLEEATQKIKDAKLAAFDESIELIVHLGINPTKSDQVVRGATTLPHGTGKQIKIAVLTQGKMAEEANAAGADLVGFADLAEKIAKDAKENRWDFDLLIASPDAMVHVGKLGRVLGPKGLMPNPKLGTVTTDIAKAIENARKGQTKYRVDKGANIHCLVGKMSFNAESLADNVKAVVDDLKKLKPSTSKGVYLRKMYLSSTMGPSLLINHKDFI